MLITPLGSAGWMAGNGRETPSFLVRSGDRALLLDAGTGIRRLVANPDLLLNVDQLDILVSHFHLDHVIGLSYLNAFNNIEFNVWGPGDLLYDVPTLDVLKRLLSPPLLSFDMTERIGAVRDIPKGSFQVNGFKVITRAQYRHTSPTIAYRIDDSLVYCTDTEYDPENADFAGGARLLLHEAWTATRPVECGHSTAVEAAEIAMASQVARLLLVHLPPNRSVHSLLEAARTVFDNSDLAEDGTTFNIGD